ncbi:MAG: SAM-dependent methyltransferase [Saprospiraceae bacterium]|nr:SAM-dependent methyltransferase [Saprospiraceae bacterium]
MSDRKSLQTGTLYLIPCPIVEGKIESIPPQTIDILHTLKYFIAEKAKTARHYIKATNPPYALQDLEMVEITKHTTEAEKQGYLKALEAGNDVGLLSEAGCPGVADPGAYIVRLAHEKNIKVVPLTGPSSILLALMASGMNGQSFCFHGYLPVKKLQLTGSLKKLETLSKTHQQTQLFIEAPYRNMQLMESALECLGPNTRFGVAANLNDEAELIKVQPIKKWDKNNLPALHKIPAVFMIMA